MIGPNIQGQVTLTEAANVSSEQQLTFDDESRPAAVSLLLSFSLTF
jgi:hypothetical protein